MLKQQSTEYCQRICVIKRRLNRIRNGAALSSSAADIQIPSSSLPYFLLLLPYVAQTLISLLMRPRDAMRQ